MPTSANTLGWAGRRFDWAIQASDIVNDQAPERPSVNALGWAGTNFDWAIQASDIVNEQAQITETILSMTPCTYGSSEIVIVNEQAQQSILKSPIEHT